MLSHGLSMVTNLIHHMLPLHKNQGRRKFRQELPSGLREERKDFLVIGSLNAEGRSSVVGAQDDTFSRVLI